MGSTWSGCAGRPPSGVRTAWWHNRWGAQPASTRLSQAAGDGAGIEGEPGAGGAGEARFVQHHDQRRGGHDRHRFRHQRPRPAGNRAGGEPEGVAGSHPGRQEGEEQRHRPRQLYLEQPGASGPRGRVEEAKRAGPRLPVEGDVGRSGRHGAVVEDEPTVPGAGDTGHAFGDLGQHPLPGRAPGELRGARQLGVQA